MTNRFLLLAIAFASACASRPPRPTTAVRYACGDTLVLRTGDTLRIDARTASASDGPIDARRLGPAQLGWSDNDGDHFVTWPHATTDVEAVEYVVPHDHRRDAVEKRYDASAGYSSSDWRLLDKRVCRAHGGYTDVLARWMAGDSLDKVARDLDLEDKGAARAIVKKALAQLTKQFYRDR